MDSKMDTKMDSGHQNCEMDVDFRDSGLSEYAIPAKIEISMGNPDDLLAS